jgi:hypothetical protein
LTFQATWNDYTPVQFKSSGKTFAYNEWDNNKVRGCVCDATYGDVDCSKRMCPYGTDVLDHRDNLLVSEKYQVQNLLFVASDSAGASSLAGSTFALTFKSRLNETFTTIPIVFDNSDLPDMVHDIQLALLNLPNRVIDGITVAANTDSSANVYVNITFTGPSVQGPQHMLTVEDYECSAGCTPKLTGLNLMTAYNQAQYSNSTEEQLSDYNSYECGRRGKCDYNTGLCGCFLGYTGENCNSLSTLV